MQIFTVTVKLLLISLIGLNSVNCVVNNVRVVDHIGYMSRVMQETMTEIENRGFSNLKLPDVVNAINTVIYTWHIEGNVTYTNGFLVGMETMDLLQSSIQQIWSYVSATDTNQVTLPVRLRLHEMALGFDVEADLIDGRSHYTGIFTHQLCEITFNVVRNMNTTEMTVSGFVQSLSGGTRRMVYSPATNLTEVFSRFYTASSAWNGITGWISDTFVPVITDVVRNRVPFPSLCYNCS